MHLECYCLQFVYSFHVVQMNANEMAHFGGTVTSPRNFWQNSCVQNSTQHTIRLWMTNVKRNKQTRFEWESITNFNIYLYLQMAHKTFHINHRRDPLNLEFRLRHTDPIKQRIVSTEQLKSENLFSTCEPGSWWFGVHTAHRYEFNWYA